MMRLCGNFGDWLLLNDSNAKQYQGTCDYEGYAYGEGVREHHFQYLKIKAVSGRLMITAKGTARATTTAKYSTPQRPVLGNMGPRTNNPIWEMDSRIAVMGTNLFFCLIFT